MPSYDGYLNYVDGMLVFNHEAVPGILLSSSISCDVKFDAAQSDQLSGKKKTPMGWEDAEITFDFKLLSDEMGDCYQKLAKLNTMFRGYGTSAQPKILTLYNRHIYARGVEQVVFKSLNSREDNREDTIVATLAFVEHTPPIVKAEQRVVKSDKAATKSGSAPAINPSKQDDYTISVDVG